MPSPEDVVYNSEIIAEQSRKQTELLPNILYKELLSIFDCLTTFLSLPVRSGFEELFPGKTFLTVSQSRDRLISCTLMTSNVKLSSVTL